ncbi:hypothetical protein Vafri_568 [Volvox africanus]|nr:hypothetical protein Vafri_568 [Volvox africanus]
MRQTNQPTWYLPHPKSARWTTFSEARCNRWTNSLEDLEQTVPRRGALVYHIKQGGCASSTTSHCHLRAVWLKTSAKPAVWVMNTTVKRAVWLKTPVKRAVWVMKTTVKRAVWLKTPAKRVIWMKTTGKRAVWMKTPVTQWITTL